ncbi:hypothetical protein [Xanthomonas theicola]|uniref:SpaN/EivJ family type III secretion system needle length determinant n=1 Tax=Xanthomonas theicola TaxID=56464 RepID=UPI000FF89701|nr:hypothetical protein [Xanthomonas theicola]
MQDIHDRLRRMAESNHRDHGRDHADGLDQGLPAAQQIPSPPPLELRADASLAVAGEKAGNGDAAKISQRASRMRCPDMDGLQEKAAVGRSHAAHMTRIAGVGQLPWSGTPAATVAVGRQAAVAVPAASQQAPGEADGGGLEASRHADAGRVDKSAAVADRRSPTASPASRTPHHDRNGAAAAAAPGAAQQAPGEADGGALEASRHVDAGYVDTSAAVADRRSPTAPPTSRTPHHDRSGAAAVAAPAASQQAPGEADGGALEASRHADGGRKESGAAGGDDSPLQATPPASQAQQHDRKGAAASTPAPASRRHADPGAGPGPSNASPARGATQEGWVYRFRSWGTEHAVRVSLVAAPHRPWHSASASLALHPSSALVEQRLNAHGAAAGASEQWILREHDDQGREDQHPRQRQEDDES